MNHKWTLISISVHIRGSKSRCLPSRWRAHRLVAQSLYGRTRTGRNAASRNRRLLRSAAGRYCRVSWGIWCFSSVGLVLLQWERLFGVSDCYLKFRSWSSLLVRYEPTSLIKWAIGTYQRICVAPSFETDYGRYWAGCFCSNIPEWDPTDWDASNLVPLGWHWSDSPGGWTGAVIARDSDRRRIAGETVFVR